MVPPWVLGEYGGYLMLDRKLSVDLFPRPAQLVCSQVIAAGVEAGLMR